VFVCDGKVTALSQQHLYDVNKLLCNKSEIEVKNIATRWVRKVLDYYNSTIRSKVPLTRCVIDIAILDNDEMYFIETNTFGTEYASGSSLFGWKEDYDILYGLTDQVEFRWTSL
jgi:hypothetical protein